jgi:hypothetical protein
MPVYATVKSDRLAFVGEAQSQRRTQDLASQSEEDASQEVSISTDLPVNTAAEVTIAEATASSTSVENDEILMPYELPARNCQDQHGTLPFGTLCCACKTVDFDALLAPAERDVAGELRRGIQLGTLPQIRDCSCHCPLCKFIVDQVPQVLGPEAIRSKAPNYKENYDDKDFYKPNDHWGYSTRIPKPDEVIISLIPFRGDLEQLQDLPMMKWDQYLKQPCASWLQILVHSGGEGFRTPDQGMAITCDTNLVPYVESSIRQPLSGRLIPPQLRYSELRRHLENCLSNHDECFLHEFKSGTVQKHFWLIDTIKRMVVPAGENTDYAALSYVWGGSRADYTHFKKLTSRNTGIWSTINRLVAGNGTPGTKLPETLPDTISDAIGFCRGIGIRFLWIDSICIDQESQEMKDYLIPRMDSIYLRAIVTIIAAAGDDANAGLPGVRPGTRSDNRDIISIQRRKFITAHAPAKEVIAKTAWWKRAWTFQEGWLSPRCFVFTPHEVLFCCTRSTNRESLHSYSPEVSNGLANRLFMTHEIGFPTGIAQISQESRISSLFNGIMRLYTKRQLTYEDDRIKAIQGCLNIITQHCSISCWHGMPMQHDAIGGALMWRHMEPSKRRNFQFPSYAWASWDREPVYFREINVFYNDFAKIEEIESHPSLPSISSGCPPLSITGPIAELYIKHLSGDEWCLDEQMHSSMALGEFGKCHPGELLSAEEFQRISNGPSEFLGIAKGIHSLSGQCLIMALMIERKEGYVVRRTIICLPMDEWMTSKQKWETLILL